jgi:hypothetical protein
MTTINRRSLLALHAAGVTAAAVPQTAGASPPTSAAAAPAAYRLVLPEPTGPYPIGTTELHLVDKSRADAWMPGWQRELMISVWYPALPGAQGPRAPYAPPHVAAPLADEVGAALGLKPGRIDYAGTPTHARTVFAPSGGTR